MHVKFLSDWRGYRANTVREIGTGQGEILIIRKIAQPAEAATEKPKRTRRKRGTRARKNSTADHAAGAAR